MRLLGIYGLLAQRWVGRGYQSQVEERTWSILDGDPRKLPRAGQSDWTCL